jgi:hypothetical protein
MLPAIAYRRRQFRGKLEAQAFIAAVMMIVRADIFLARSPY